MILLLLRLHHGRGLDISKNMVLDVYKRGAGHLKVSFKHRPSPTKDKRLMSVNGSAEEKRVFHSFLNYFVLNTCYSFK